MRRAPLVTVLFERGGNESREKRMRLIRAGFEFRMILNADIEIPVCQFHRFDKSAVGRKTGERQSCRGERLAVIIIEFIAVTMTLGNVFAP